MLGTLDFASVDAGLSFVARRLASLSTGTMIAIGLLWLELHKYKGKGRNEISYK